MNLSTQQHLIVVSIGPVHDFVSAARRTRDLWFGSKLLSDVCGAIASAIKNCDEKAELIFPNQVPSKQSDSVSNVILAIVPESKLAGLYFTIAQAARTQFKHAADIAHKFAITIIDPIEWEKQINSPDFPELFFATEALNNNYKESRRNLMLKLASQKMRRDFAQTDNQESKPKSALDGVRHSVFIEKKRRNEILRKNAKLRFALRLNDGEELDLLGLIKRVANQKSFPSVTRIAIDPWVRGLTQIGEQTKPILDSIAELLRNSDELATYSHAQNRDPNAPTHTAGVGDFDHLDSFPFDGQLFLEGRIEAMLDEEKRYLNEQTNESNNHSSGHKKVYDTLAKIKPKIGELHQAMGGSPHPYYALLLGDGDKMGELLSHANSPEQHRAISAKLIRIAAQFNEEIKKHRGVGVFSAGEDGLAFLPLNQVIQAAQSIQKNYSSMLNDIDWIKKLKTTPTFSIGIAVVHCLDSLGDAITQAHAALYSAKQLQKYSANVDNGAKLCIHWVPRNGAPFQLGGNASMSERIDYFAELNFKDAIADAFGYRIQRLAQTYRDWPKGPHTPSQSITVGNSGSKNAVTRGKTQSAAQRQFVSSNLTEALSLELTRLLFRRKISNNEREQFSHCIDDVLVQCNRQPALALQQLAQEIIFSRRIAESMRDASPSTPSISESSSAKNAGEK